MLKRIIPIILCFVLLSGIRVMAENDTVHADAASETQQVTQDENSFGSFSNGGSMPEDMQFPGGNGFPGMQSAEDGQTEADSNFFKTYSTPITALFLLLLAFVFVVFYRRKHF